MWMWEWVAGRLIVMLWMVFCLLAGMVREKGLGRLSVGAVVIVILGMRASLVPRRM